MLGVSVSGIRAAILATIRIGHRNLVNPGRTALPTRAIELVRADIDHRAGVPVISTVNDDDIIPAGIGARQAQRQFIRFAAAVYQKHDAQRVRQRCSEPLAVFDQQFMQIARVGIEPGHLLARGLHDIGMTVSDVRDVIDAVEITATRRVE